MCGRRKSLKEERGETGTGTLRWTAEGEETWESGRVLTTLLGMAGACGVREEGGREGELCEGISMKSNIISG